jgi:hypothetical protein
MTTDTTATTETTYELTLEEEAQQFVKEHNADGIVARLVKLEERCVELQQNQERVANRLQEERNVVRNNRETVRNKFEEMLDGDKNATIEMDLDAINELLEDIGASPIRFTWSVDVKVTATITGIEAQNEEEAREKVLRAIELRVETERLGDNADVDDEDYEVDNVEEETN